jgi:hypothetical protein
VVAIDNLSGGPITVSLVPLDTSYSESRALIAELKSPNVPVDGQIEIIFSFEDNSIDSPILALVKYEICPTSKKTSLVARSEICAYARVTPVYAVIRSSAGFFLTDERSVILCPADPTLSIELEHVLPEKVALSPGSMMYSMNSDPQNKIEEPQASFQENRLVLVFPTKRTGRCLGSLRMNLGRQLLYELALDVFVSRMASVGICHPVDPKNSEVTLVGCSKTFLWVYNWTSDVRHIHLRSTKPGIDIQPSTLELNGQTVAHVVVALVANEERVVSLSAGSVKQDFKFTTMGAESVGFREKRLYFKDATIKGVFLPSCVAKSNGTYTVRHFELSNQHGKDGKQSWHVLRD